LSGATGRSRIRVGDIRDPAAARTHSSAATWAVWNPDLGYRLDRHCATRRLRRLAAGSVVWLLRRHPHMLRHIFVTTS
ncbi:MAG: hypothetical protein LC799_01360, partial [Actinobacteria bacterium]|nr:hypothetical protein [Actinomycetota bacterium]